ncbi:DUF5686 and carboxypeptidase regulatory-like domain-containing protein [Flavobacterium difficile]|uniref:Carboxypeptidase-like regulatory domain-containing protein n=1 Tax=Flavobacterium difficile TaxID=2709659 RepID=A0ABX0I0Z4_9FLAO|nr:DUF5686 and carboxypeptidase regulatory-like domain-containing protein [Flavobacterium difficile]NHM00861.1 carboxypeptidase-like regulatory domain-containing protein [Flavobacterium difficile]
MKLKVLFALALISHFSFAQIRGKVTDSKGNALPYASVTIEKTYNGTSTNENGEYELTVKKTGTYTLVFKILGYKTQTISKEINAFPAVINATLSDEEYSIEEVVVKNGENPANAIIRSAIANRKKNTDKTDKYEADFYSRGIFRVKDIPKKFMGVEIGDLEGNLDSTGAGIIYQSETVSKIKFEKPNNIKEEILASKVAGNDNGFSFNTALSTNYDFYQNTINFGIPMISPIASNAFNYYKYKIEDSFTDGYNNFVYKIKVTPKRDKEPVFEGYIYIVDDSFAIYATDLDIKGYRAQSEFLETLKLTQNFNYNPDTKIWIKNLQSLDFKAGIFMMKFNGKFTHVFSNYNFVDSFDKKTFGSELVTFAEKSNKKEDSYWSENRPVPLTDEETTNYIKKDSVYKVRNSQVYLDSVDVVSNKFKISKIITGYTFKNSFKKSRFNYQGLFNLAAFNFNTVQGYHIGSGFSYTKFNEEKRKYTSIATDFQYGFSDERIRPTASFYHKFNNTNDAYIRLTGGNKVNQFNSSEPISGIENSVSSLVFKNNFMKLYEKEFIEIASGREVFNGFFLNANLAYENRKPLFNTTDFAINKTSDVYSSNNPLNPLSDAIAAFDEHHLTKFSLSSRIVFGQKYITRPDGKLNINEGKYPTLGLTYTKAFLATSKGYEYDFVEARLNYNKTLANKGDLQLNMKVGKFFNADNISFADFKHFNGNQTHVRIDGQYNNSFNLLPYYTQSTNDQYFETHVNYNDNGYFMNKIPVLNQLGWNLVGGFHQLAAPQNKPYQEMTVGFDRIGFGKLKIFRVDYVRSFQGGVAKDGLMFGLRF